MIRSYKLDGHTPVQTNSVEAALWRDNNYSACVVGLDEWGEGAAHVTVSTVFLAFDHRRIGEDGDPILFETMVFGGPHSDKQARYTTWEGAAMGHDEMVKRCRFDGDPQAEIASLLARAEKAEAALALAVAELHNIANSRPHEWPEETRNQFQPWAQSRARHTLAAIAANPLPEAPVPDELDKIRDAIAHRLGWAHVDGWWRYYKSDRLVSEKSDHPVPASLDWVAQQWPSNYYLAVRTAPGIEGWEASAMPHDEFEFHVVRTAATELHARLALLLAVLEAEAT